MTAACKICDLANADEPALLALSRPEVFATPLWRCVLNGPDQRYPGRCIVAARRHVAALPDLDAAEWRELQAVMRRLEAAARQALGATLANWGCLMNHAFQQDPPRPHVHLHFRPRYAEPVRIAGLSFEDDAFGRHYRREYRALDPRALLRIRDQLRAATQG